MKQNKVTTSVALATYNGALHLEEQLNSIISQTVPPNEIIISDDGSTDDSVAVARSVLSKSSVQFKIIRHEVNRGFSSNFNTALMKAKGDLVFICDQDDVWISNKIEYFLDHAMTSNLHLTMSDMVVADKDLNVLEGSFLESSGIMKNEYAYGCNMAIGRQLLDVALPVPHKYIQHDVWLNMLANILNVKTVLPEAKILYRRHSKNFTSKLAGKKEGVRELFVNSRQFRARVLDRKMAQSIALERIAIAYNAGMLDASCANQATSKLLQDLLVSTTRISGSTFLRVFHPLRYFHLYSEAGISPLLLLKDTLLLNCVIQRKVEKCW